MTSLAVHEADSVDAIAELHREHHANSSGAQRLIDRITATLGRPLAAIIFLVAVVIWIGFAALAAGGDVGKPVYGWLEFVATLGALLIAILILVTQRRADELAERRAQLTLHLAVLADKRSAKLIALLEELRRDDPNVANRLDRESEAMAEPTDPRTVSAAIEQPIDKVENGSTV